MNQVLTKETAEKLLRYDDGKLIWINGSRGIAGCVNKVGYVVIGINWKSYLAHRLVWLLHHGCFPNGIIDHIDTDRKNNRIENLRIATKSQNGFNRDKSITNTSGFKGVSYSKNAKKWESRINNKHLGYFNTPQEAHEVYKQKAFELHGDFANFHKINNERKQILEFCAKKVSV